MRKFAETLPTLRETPSSSPAAPEPIPGFEPDAILKSLAQCDHAGRTAQSRTSLAGRKTLQPAFTAERLPKAHATTVANPDGAASERQSDAAERAAPAPEKTITEREAHDALRTAVTAARSEEEARAQQNLDAARQEWAQDTSETLMAKLDEAYAALHNRIADALADALTPLLAESAKQKAVERFAERLSRLIGADAPVAPITVKGPPVLLDALRKVAPAGTASLKLVPAETSELEANVNETTLRTTLRAYTATLNAAAGPRHVAK